jgi:hypothetical protein
MQNSATHTTVPSQNYLDTPATVGDTAFGQDFSPASLKVQDTWQSEHCEPLWDSGTSVGECTSGADQDPVASAIWTPGTSVNHDTSSRRIQEDQGTPSHQLPAPRKEVQMVTVETGPMLPGGRPSQHPVEAYAHLRKELDSDKNAQVDMFPDLDRFGMGTLEVDEDTEVPAIAPALPPLALTDPGKPYSKGQYIIPNAGQSWTRDTAKGTVEALETATLTQLSNSYLAGNPILDAWRKAHTMAPISPRVVSSNKASSLFLQDHPDWKEHLPQSQGMADSPEDTTTYRINMGVKSVPLPVDIVVRQNYQPQIGNTEWPPSATEIKGLMKRLSKIIYPPPPKTKPPAVDGLPKRHTLLWPPTDEDIVFLKLFASCHRWLKSTTPTDVPDTQPKIRTAKFTFNRRNMVDKAVLMVVYTEREEKPGRLEIPVTLPTVTEITVLLHRVLEGTSTKQTPLNITESAPLVVRETDEVQFSASDSFHSIQWPLSPVGRAELAAFLWRCPVTHSLNVERPQMPSTATSLGTTALYEPRQSDAHHVPGFMSTTGTARPTFRPLERLSGGHRKNSRDAPMSRNTTGNQAPVVNNLSRMAHSENGQFVGWTPQQFASGQSGTLGLLNAPFDPSGPILNSEITDLETTENISGFFDDNGGSSGGSRLQQPDAISIGSSPGNARYVLHGGFC